MRWELRRGRALDIWSTGEYPADVLSNLCSNRFRLDGIECQSMEGFLQSLKYEDSNRQRQICSMKGRNAKRQSTTTWQTDQVVWWRGRAIDRQGTEYRDLLRRAYQAMFDQNDRFRAALMASRGRRLYHRGDSQAGENALERVGSHCRKEVTQSVASRFLQSGTHEVHSVKEHSEGSQQSENL